jgi:hypothetical protein
VLDGETGCPIANCANTEDHHVHHHRMGDVFVAREAGLNQGKTGLHKEDKHAREKHPQDVEAENRVAAGVSQLLGVYALLSQNATGSEYEYEQNQYKNKLAEIFDSFHHSPLDNSGEWRVISELNTHHSPLTTHHSSLSTDLIPAGDAF